MCVGSNNLRTSLVIVGMSMCSWICCVFDLYAFLSRVGVCMLIHYYNITRTLGDVINTFHIHNYSRRIYISMRMYTFKIVFFLYLDLVFHINFHFQSFDSIAVLAESHPSLFVACTTFSQSVPAFLDRLPLLLLNVFCFFSGLQLMKDKTVFRVQFHTSREV